MTLQERLRIRDEAEARAAADHKDHVRAWWRQQILAVQMARIDDEDDLAGNDDAEDEDEDDGYTFEVDERREYGTLWALNGSMVG